MTHPGRHPLYQPVRDLPGLVTPAAMEIDLDAILAGMGADAVTFEAPAPARNPHDVAAAVAAYQAPGRVLQAKVDGCWACIDIGHEGRIDAVWSRANLPLRQGVPWLQQTTHRALTGWHIIGELEAGTTRAHLARTARGEIDRFGHSTRPPMVHVYGAVDPDGRDRTADIGDLVTLLPGAFRPVSVADSDWYAYTVATLESGGEGVVIRDGDALWRAKGSHTADRVIVADITEDDRNGEAIRKLCLGVWGGRRYERLQWVVAPAWWQLSPRQAHHAVVEVVGWGESDEGVLRHAQVLRIREDKPPRECLTS